MHPCAYDADDGVIIDCLELDRVTGTALSIGVGLDEIRRWPSAWSRRLRGLRD